MASRSTSARFHSKGAENTTADAMSRLCVNNSPPKSETVNMSAVDGEYCLSDNAYDNLYQCHNAIVGHGGFK